MGGPGATRARRLIPNYGVPVALLIPRGDAAADNLLAQNSKRSRGLRSVILGGSR